ncbi:MAG: ParB N-terminal domain-containing protein [Lachnospiraceae bacterium]|nr:ParB N-terminal domain-containing protein [Lachnospiraceae bacterium]
MPNDVSIKTISIDELKPYDKNPRKNDEAVKYVANSIKEFGFKVPIIVDKDNVIVAGHTRYKAAKELGLTEVPCIVADDLTPKQIKAFRLADNKVSEFAQWDFDLLGEELGELELDMTEFGFEDFTEGLDELDVDGGSRYSRKVKIPQYEPTGEYVTFDQCVDLGKTNELIEEIEAADIDEATKDFLKEAAHRHSVFNYRNIAEFYANASPEVQRLMERSALVIIDIDDAIANGYVKLTKTIQDIMDEDADNE